MVWANEKTNYRCSRNYAAGDNDAFKLVRAAIRQPLLATARRFLNNEHDAQDAVQRASLLHFEHSIIQRRSHALKLVHRIVVTRRLVAIATKKRRGEQPIEKLLPRFDQTASGSTIR